MLDSRVKFIQITMFIYSTFTSFDFVRPEAGSNNISKIINIMPAIVGGHDALIRDYPYQVSISLGSGDNDDSFWCAGFIVSENYVLTAAHCLSHVNYTMVVIRAGSTHWQKNGTIIRISEAILHPDFKFEPPFDKDVAVMKTVHPIKFTDVVQAVKLPRKYESLQDGSIVAVSGWGRTAYNEPESAYLKAVKIPVVNFNICREAYNNTPTGNMWCGGDFESGGIGTCNGDSGGAVIQDGVVYGIVSWSQPCAVPHKPSVFTNITAPAVRDFIAKYTGL